MNFLFVPYLEEVPEWKECYYDYKTLRVFMKFINSCVEIISEIETSSKLNEDQISKGAMEKIKHEVLEIVEFQCSHFKHYSHEEFKLVSVFIWYKIYEVDSRYRSYMQLLAILGRNNQNVQLLIENLYIEAFYLERTTSYNVAKQYETMRKFHEQIGNDVPPLNLKNQEVRIQEESEKLLNKIYFTYASQDKEVHDYLNVVFKRQEKKSLKKNLQSVELGMIMGIICGFLGVLIIIQIVDSIDLSNNEEFLNNFPAWRGAAEVVFYVWVLGFNILFYEKSQINYKMIFYFEKNYSFPSSKIMFILASTFSFLYLFLMMLEFLHFDKIINTGFNSYPQLFWLIFIVFLFNPLPFLHREGRYYTLKLLFKVISSPCIPMNFLIIWYSEQIVSLTQPLTDFFYTCCYFFSKDLAKCKAVTPNFNSGIVIGIFAFRMYQNLKLWNQLCQAKPDKKYDFWLPPFLGFIRATSGLCASTVAIFNRLKVFKGAFPLWLVVIIISTIVSWYVDVKGDWGLLNHQTKTILRQKLLFPKAKYLYYFMGVFDLVLRVGWAFTIAPFVINSKGIWPLLFTMIVSFIEIFRRGVWNTLRLEFEHVKNCGAYQATIKDDHIYALAKKESEQVQKDKKELRKVSAPLESEVNLIKNNLNLSLEQEADSKLGLKEEELQEMRIKRELELFKLILKERNERKRNINVMLEQNKRKITEILKEFKWRKIKSMWATIKKIEDE